MPASTPIDPAKLRVNQPCAILFAPIGSDLPTHTVAGSVFTDDWPEEWLYVGPTDSGLKVTHSIDTDTVEVEEDLEALYTITTGRSTTVAFTVVNDRDNFTSLKLALNGGTVVSTGSGATALNKYSPPLIGNENRVMLGYETLDHRSRGVFFQALQTNTVDPEYRKGTARVQYPLEFAVERPAAAVASVPWNRWDAGTGA